MKTTFLLFVSIIVISTSLFGQNPIIWKKTFNSTYPRSVIDLLIIDTSYYILIEKTQNYFDVELISINKNSSKIGVSKVYSGTASDRPTSFYKNNSSLTVFGTTNSTEGIFVRNHGYTDNFFIKTDMLGVLIDTSVYGGSNSENGTTSRINSNKYICIGASNSINGDLSNCSPTITSRQWIYIQDSLGAIKHSICNDSMMRLGDFYFHNNNYLLFGYGTVTANGGYTYPYYSANGTWQGYSNDIVVIEYDTSFNIINIKNYGSDSQEGLKKSIRTADNGFMLFGYTDYIHDTLEVNDGVGARDLYCVKLDSNVNFQWSKCLGSLGADEPWDITQTADHGYLVIGEIQQASGNVSNFYGQRDIWLAKIDSVGNLMWERTYGGSDFDRANVVREDSDGTIVLAGVTRSNDGTFSGMSIQGGSDMFVIKLAPWVGIEKGEEVKTTISVYPNPTYSGGSINLSGLSPVTSNYQLSIYNLQGQQMHSENFSAANRKKVQLPQLADGMYFIRLQNTEGHVSNAKFIVN